MEIWLIYIKKGLFEMQKRKPQKGLKSSQAPYGHLLETPFHDFPQKLWDWVKEWYNLRTFDLIRTNRKVPPKGRPKPFGGFTCPSSGNPTFSFYASQG